MPNNYTSLEHSFLVAMPHVKDPLFIRSIVYLSEYNEKGAKGVIINKPMKSCLGDLLKHLEIPTQNEIARSHPILMGGPVASEQVFLVQRKHDVDFETGKIHSYIEVSSSKSELFTLAEGKRLNDTLIAIGYVDWDANQLDEELKNNDWLVTPFDESALFAILEDQILSGVSTSEDWHSAINRLGISLNDLALPGGNA